MAGGARGEDYARSRHRGNTAHVKLGYWDEGINGFYIVFALKKLLCAVRDWTKSFNQPRKSILAQFTETRSFDPQERG